MADPYRVELQPNGHLRLTPDYAVSRAIAADIVARERIVVRKWWEFWK